MKNSILIIIPTALFFAIIGIVVLGNTSDIGKEETEITDIPKDDEKPDTARHAWDCASVSVEKLSLHDLETLQNRPNRDPLLFLNFTDENLSQSKILRDLVDIVDSREYPPNDRGYGDLNVEEMVIIQHLLVEKSIAKYGGTEYDYSQSVPMLHYDDDPDRWEQDKHRWEGYLTGFRPPTIVYHDSLYGINGLGSGIRSHALEKTINVQLLDMTEQEYLARNSEDKFIEIAENEMDMMPAVKNAISQIGTWEKSIKESQYTGDKIQQETLSYFQFETANQLSDFDDGYIVDFAYNGNYYRTGYLVC